MHPFLLLILLSFSTVSWSSIPEAKVAQLKELRQQIRTWARVCPDGSMTNSDECPFGDMTIFAGLACLSGEEQRCEDVRKAQGKSGEWFRAPGRVDIPREDGGPDFSRDQSMGVQAYLIATKDTAAANLWMDFIERNNWRLCQRSEEGWNACYTPITWWFTVGKVWDYLGLKRNKKMKHSNYIVQNIYQPIEARVQPNDYPLHLTALAVYLRQELAKRTGKADAHPKEMAKLIKIINQRSPQNPFFNYLKNGPTEAAADTVFKYCPKEAPAKIDGRFYGDWIWQRSTKDTLDHREEMTWDYPGGWECIFMINLLIGAEAPRQM